MRISSEKSNGLWSVYAEPGEWELYMRGAWRKWPDHEIRVGFINERGTMKMLRPGGGGMPREYGQLAKFKLENARAELIQRGSLHADIKKEAKKRKEEAKEGSFIVRTTTGKETRFHEYARAMRWAERVLKLSPKGMMAGIFRPGHNGRPDLPVATYTKDEYGRIQTGGYDAFPKSGSPKRGSGRPKYFYIEETRLGPSAVAIDYKGASVNVINGDRSETVESIRRAAHRHWPGLPEKNRHGILRSPSKAYGSIKPPIRVKIVVGSGANYFKPGQFGYVVGYDTRGGQHFVNANRVAAPGEMAYLVAKSREARGGALWFSRNAISSHKKLP